MHTSNKTQKGRKPTATFEVLGAEAGYGAWSLHTAPPRGWTDHLSYSSTTTHPSSPTLTPFKEPAVLLWEWARETVFVFAPSCCSMSLNKALPDFLIWPLINFYWLKNPRTQVSNKHITSIQNLYTTIKMKLKRLPSNAKIAHILSKVFLMLI